MDNTSTDYSVIIPAGVALLSFVCLLFALRAGKRQRLIENIPTSKTTGVFMGLVELKGTAEAVQPLVSYLAEQACVSYTWSVQEHWSRTVTETYKDNEGRTQTRTRHESGWTTVDSGGEFLTSFYLQDDCGIIRICPEGADLRELSVMYETCGPGDPLYYSKGPAGAIADSDHRRQFTESIIPLHAPLFVIGQARERDDIVEPEIAKDPAAEVFIISATSEESVTSGFRWTFWGLNILGLVLAAGTVFARVIILNRDPANEVGLFAAAAGVYMLIWFLGWVWMVYNSMIDLRERVKSALANVDVQLKRRNDLIPMLLAPVLAFRDHEHQLQENIAKLREQSGSTLPGQVGPDPLACSRTIKMIVEGYPSLKADQSFLKLQKNLIDTEQRISLARSYFNDIATFYNTRLEVIPDRFIAALGIMPRQQLITAQDFERTPVHVQLAS